MGLWFFNHFYICGHIFATWYITAFFPPRCKTGDLSLIPGLGRSSGEGNDNPLQYSCLERILAGCSPWGHRELDTIKWLTLLLLLDSSNSVVIELQKSWLIWKEPDAGKDWGQEEKGDDRGWDGWMTSLTQWTWVWVDSRSWWWTGRPGVLRFIGSQRVRHDWATKLNWYFFLL